MRWSNEVQNKRHKTEENRQKAQSDYRPHDEDERRRHTVDEHFVTCASVLIDVRRWKVVQRSEGSWIEEEFNAEIVDRLTSEVGAFSAGEVEPMRFGQ